jgi:mannose-6-phosphate isomerase-like protein (cupin superfamily)
MAKRAFVIAGDRAATVANDVADFHYRAAAHILPVGVQVAARVNPLAETQLLVEDGLVEIMVGGASAPVPSGDFVRVPPGVAFAYRNAGDGPATILMRTTSPVAGTRAARWSGLFAA